MPIRHTPFGFRKNQNNNNKQVQQMNNKQNELTQKLATLYSAHEKLSADFETIARCLLAVMNLKFNVPPATEQTPYLFTAVMADANISLSTKEFFGRLDQIKQEIDNRTKQQNPTTKEQINALQQTVIQLTNTINARAQQPVQVQPVQQAQPPPEIVIQNPINHMMEPQG